MALLDIYKIENKEIFKWIINLNINFHCYTGNKEMLKVLKMKYLHKIKKKIMVKKNRNIKQSIIYKKTW